MELKKGQVVHVGKTKYTGTIPDELAVKLGLKKVKKEKKELFENESEVNRKN